MLKVDNIMLKINSKIFYSNFISLAPFISTLINESTRAITGESYNLTCKIVGVENVHPSITYQWTKNSDRGEIQNLGSNSSTLPFTPLQLSDAGNYSCMTTITSSYLTSGITTMVSHSLRIQSRF